MSIPRGRRPQRWPNWLGERPVHRPDERARASADRAGRQRSGVVEAVRDTLGLTLELVQLALVVHAPRAHLGQGAALVAARALVADAGVDELLLDPRDLVAAGQDDLGDPLLPALEAIQAGGRGLGVHPGVAHRADDALVLLADASQELAALEEVGEAVGVEHDGDDVVGACS